MSPQANELAGKPFYKERQKLHDFQHCFRTENRVWLTVQSLPKQSTKSEKKPLRLERNSMGELLIYFVSFKMAKHFLRNLHKIMVRQELVKCVFCFIILFSLMRPGSLQGKF